MSDNILLDELGNNGELSTAQILRLSPEIKEMMAREYPTSYENFVEQLYKDIDKVIYNIESARKHHQESGEDAITSNIITQLKMHYKSVYPEVEDGGHCDIYVEHSVTGRLPYKWIGEAKVWGGAAYGIKGMKQLIESYASGTVNATHGGILFYCIKPSGALGLMSEWKTSINENYPTSELAQLDELGLRFQSKHKLSSGSGLDFTVKHFAISLYHEPTQKVIKTRKEKEIKNIKAKLLKNNI